MRVLRCFFLRWLKWVSAKEGVTIQHARNEGEFKVGNFKADGYCRETNTIYEFHGCKNLLKLVASL